MAVLLQLLASIRPGGSDEADAGLMRSTRVRQQLSAIDPSLNQVDRQFLVNLRARISFLLQTRPFERYLTMVHDAGLGASTRWHAKHALIAR